MILFVIFEKKEKPVSENRFVIGKVRGREENGFQKGMCYLPKGAITNHHKLDYLKQEY